MAYWERPNSANASLDATSVAGAANRKQALADAFYEIEAAIVLDVILDKDHPYFNNTKIKLKGDQWPVGVDKKPAEKTDLDYTWIGKVLIRLLNTQRNIEKEDLIWASPLESNVSEYPVLNEVVGVIQHLGQYFYTRKINVFNTPNANGDFNLEVIYGGFKNAPDQKTQGNREYLFNPTDTKKPFLGPTSSLAPTTQFGYQGAMGRYFLYNNRIRSIKRREGDLVIESRFGQSIRFGAYDDDRTKDKGDTSYDDYKGTSPNPFSNQIAGGGNPQILIRNRQRPILPAGATRRIYDNPNIPVVTGTEEEKNVGGYILEDINNDGTSIHITSGLTISAFKTNCFKKLWGTGEEQANFNGQTNFKYPTLLGDQIVINSDRVIVSAKKGEMFQFAKKRMAFVTDDEYTVDAHNQIVLNTNNKTVINSPAIYLGEYNQTNEPALLGQTSVNWLYDLCNWLLQHTHWYMHTHPDAQGGNTGQSNPNQTQTPVQNAALIVLREKLNLLMSRRVFLVGGGFAPGQNGGSMQGGVSPVSISIPSGAGAPGGFSGTNKKLTAADKQTIKSEIAAGEAAGAQAKASADSAATSAAAVSAGVKETQDINKVVNNSVTHKAVKDIEKLNTQATENNKQAQAWAADAQSASAELAATKL